jgi:hypothetical protein
MKGLPMSDLAPMPGPPSRRGPLSTIAGWMTLIAVIGVTMALMIEVPGLMIVAAPLSVLVPIGLIETLAARRFMSYRRGGRPMSAYEEAAWILALSVLIPTLGVVAVIAAAVHYFSTYR